MPAYFLAFCAGVLLATAPLRLVDAGIQRGTPSLNLSFDGATAAAPVIVPSRGDPASLPVASIPAQDAPAADDTSDAGTNTDEADDDGLSPWLIAGILALIVIGLVTGWVLAGRRRLS